MRVLSSFFMMASLGLFVLSSASPAFAELVAQTGLNDALGINADGAPNSPYELNAALEGQGASETGWGSAWLRVQGTANDATRAAVVSGIPEMEGDGALQLAPTLGNNGAHDAAFKRLLATAADKQFVQVDFDVYIDSWTTSPANVRSMIFYIGDETNLATAGIDNVAALFDISQDDRKLIAWNGDGGGGLAQVQTGKTLELDKWYTVSALLDQTANTWSLLLDGETVATNLGYRVNDTSINAFQLWGGRGSVANESGQAYVAYLDSITVSQVPEPGAIVLAGIGCIGVGLLRLRRKK